MVDYLKMWRRERVTQEGRPIILDALWRGACAVARVRDTEKVLAYALDHYPAAATVARANPKGEETDSVIEALMRSVERDRDRVECRFAGCPPWAECPDGKGCLRGA